MYRMSRVFETSSVTIVKVAGQVTDADARAWTSCLEELGRDSFRWVVLDFCDISRIETKAAEILIRTLPRQVLLLNCSTGIKNMADSAGLGNQVLEPACGQGQVRNLCFLNLGYRLDTLGQSGFQSRGGGQS